MDNFLLAVGGALNPVTAARKVRGKLIEKGIIQPHVSDMFGHQNMAEWIDSVEKAVALKRVTDNMNLVDPNVLYDSKYGDLLDPKLHNMERASQADAKRRPTNTTSILLPKVQKKGVAKP